MATDNANPTVLEMATANTNPIVTDVDKDSITHSSTFDGIEWPDYVVIAIYFLSVLAVGIYVSISLSNKTNYSNSLPFNIITASHRVCIQIPYLITVLMEKQTRLHWWLLPCIS